MARRGHHHATPWQVEKAAELGIDIPLCDLPTIKACDDRKADWDAMQMVILAYNVASRGDRIKEDNVLAQLIDVIGGHKEVIMTKEGNPSVTPWVKRLYAAMERFKAGDLPAYNLYEPEPPNAAR